MEMSSGRFCTTPLTIETALEAVRLFHIQSQMWSMQPQRWGPAVSADWSAIS